MPTTKAIVTAYVKSKLRALSAAGHSGEEIASKTGALVKEETVNLVKNGKRNVGDMQPWANLFTGGSIDRLKLDANAYAAKNPDEVIDDEADAGPGIPGWDAAEAVARKSYAKLQIPDWAWLQARTIMGAVRPERITPEAVKDAAFLALQHGQPAQVKKAKKK